MKTFSFCCFSGQQQPQINWQRIIDAWRQCLRLSSIFRFMVMHFLVATFTRYLICEGPQFRGLRWRAGEFQSWWNTNAQRYLKHPWKVLLLISSPRNTPPCVGGRMEKRFRSESTEERRTFFISLVCCAVSQKWKVNQHHGKYPITYKSRSGSGLHLNWKEATKLYQTDFLWSFVPRFKNCSIYDICNESH